MLKEKLNKIYNEMVEDNKKLGYENSKNIICSQMWQRISLGDRQQIMSMRTKEYKTIQANFNACIKIVESFIDDVTENNKPKEEFKIHTLSDVERKVWENRVNQYAGRFLAENGCNSLINENILQKTFKDCVMPAPKFLYGLITEEIQRMIKLQKEVSKVEQIKTESQEKQKVTHNEYDRICKELADRVWKKDETKITMKQFNEMLDDYEILPFEIGMNDEELKKIINTYAETDQQEDNRVLYRGHIDKQILYNLYQNSDYYKDLYVEYYQIILCNDDLKCILTYCEGDFTAELYNSLEEYNKAIETTKKFIEEM